MERRRKTDIPCLWGCGASGKSSLKEWYMSWNWKQQQIAESENTLNKCESWVVETRAQGRWNSICEGLKQKGTRSTLWIRKNREWILVTESLKKKSEFKNCGSVNHVVPMKVFGFDNEL